MGKGAANVRVILGRMDRMLSNLLDLAGLNAGKLRVVPQSLDAGEVAREAVEVFRPLAEEKHLSLHLVQTDGPFEARLDHDRVFQVLSNLLSNAIKFSPPGGKIFVSLATVDDCVEIAVQDFGQGIEENDLERILECYRQLDGSDVTGLGPKMARVSVPSPLTSSAFVENSLSASTGCRRRCGLRGSAA